MPLTQNSSLFDLVFGRFEPKLEAHPPLRSYLVFPQIDVVELEDRCELYVDLPGVAREDVTLTTQEGVLIISGERKLNDAKRWSGKFSKQVSLDGLDPDHITAEMKNGVLTVSIPKATKQSRQIEIS